MSNDPGPHGPSGRPDPQGSGDQSGFGRPTGPSFGAGPAQGQPPYGGGAPQGPYGGPPPGYPTGPQSAPQGYPTGPQSAPQSYPTGPQSANPPQGPYPGAGQPGPYAGGPQGYGYQQQPGPYAGQPGPGGFPPAGPGPGGPVKKKRTGLFILIGVGALVLILIVVFAGVALFGKKSTTAGGGGTGSGGQSSAPAPKKPSDAVTAYLQALAAGKATDALALSSDQPPSTTFLTDAVLQAAIKKAPITGIDVTPTSGSSTYAVDATYKIGSQTVTDTIEVEQAGDQWKVKQAWAQASLYQDSDLPLFLNGVQAKEDKVYLFPGVYTASTGNAYVGYGSNTSVLVKSPSDYPSFSALEPTLTSAGKSAFTSTVKSALSACVKSHSLKPGCGLGGFHASKGVKVTDIRHKLASGSVDHLSVDLSASDPYTARAYPTVRISTTAKCNGGGCTGLYDQYIGSVSVDLSKKPLRASWG